MLKRTWVSTTPEAFKGNIATWAWVRQYYSLPEVDRPQFGRARLSILLTVGSFLEGPDVMGICVGQCKWGGLYLPCECVQGRFYRVTHNVAFCHITYPLQWKVYTQTPAIPLSLQSFQPGVFRNEMLMERALEPTPMMKLRLSTAESIKSLNFESLNMLCGYFGSGSCRSRAGCL